MDGPRAPSVIIYQDGERVNSPSTMRQMPREFWFFNSSGRAMSGKS
jgi:hypothetical protein